MKVIRLILFIIRIIIQIIIGLVFIIIGTIIYPFLRWYSGISYLDWLYLIFEWLGDRENEIFNKK